MDTKEKKKEKKNIQRLNIKLTYLGCSESDEKKVYYH